MMSDGGDATRILQEALDAEASQRDRIVRDRCGDDEKLRGDVMSLLRAAERAGGFLETPAIVAMTTGDHREDEWTGLGPGDRIGPYQIVRRVGSGGMGDVYLAEQREPITRRVAIKVVKPGMDSRAILSRFRHERQTLSMLGHAGIARVYDAGSTERGLPYFVMEFVDGVPITEYLKDRAGTLEERIEIFREVCAAVHHAHQKGVIHRDLKPSNVLVEETGAGPVVKVIDFGIAKALSDEGDEASIATRAGQFIGTPEYMAPEQASGAADVRSDVFSLGVMLYQILTGTLPVDRDRVRRMTGRELSEYLSKATPRKPSTVLAERRREEREPSAGRPGVLNRELDWIVMRCLEAVPGRRYASVAALSDDLGRMIRHEPVEAGPPGRLYRASKFVRRNRAGVIGAAAACLALAGGTVAASIGFVRARDSQHEAERAARHAEKVSEFLERMLLTVRPQIARGLDTALLQKMVDEAEAGLDDELEGVPEAEADIRLTLSRIYGAVGNWEKSGLHASLAKDLYERTQGATGTDTIAAMDWLATAKDMRGDAAGGIEIGKDSLARAERAFGRDHEQTVTCMNNLGNIYLGAYQLDEAEPLLVESYDRLLAIKGEHDSGTLAAMSNLSTLRERQGRLDEAIEIMVKCLRLRTEALGEDEPGTIIAINNLSSLYQYADRFADAEPLLCKAVELSTRVNGPDHPSTLASMNNLGSIYKATGRYDKAEEMFLRASEGLERRHGRDSFEWLASRRNLGEVVGLLGRLDEAESIMREVTERSAQVLAPAHPLNAIAPAVLAMGLSRQGRLQDAYGLLKDAWDLISRAPPPGNASRSEVLRGLVFLSQRVDTPEANAAWRELFIEATGQSQTPEDHAAAAENAETTGPPAGASPR